MPMYWKRVRPLRDDEIDGELVVYKHLGAIAYPHGDEGVLLLVPTNGRGQSVRAILDRYGKEDWEQVHLTLPHALSPPPLAAVRFQYPGTFRRREHAAAVAGRLPGAVFTEKDGHHCFYVRSLRPDATRRWLAAQMPGVCWLEIVEGAAP